MQSEQKLKKREVEKKKRGREKKDREKKEREKKRERDFKYLLTLILTGVISDPN